MRFAFPLGVSKSPTDNPHLTVSLDAKDDPVMTDTNLRILYAYLGQTLSLTVRVFFQAPTAQKQTAYRLLSADHPSVEMCETKTSKDPPVDRLDVDDSPHLVLDNQWVVARPIRPGFSFPDLSGPKVRNAKVENAPGEPFPAVPGYLYLGSGTRVSLISSPSLDSSASAPVTPNEITLCEHPLAHSTPAVLLGRYFRGFRFCPSPGPNVSASPEPAGNPEGPKAKAPAPSLHLQAKYLSQVPPSRPVDLSSASLPWRPQVSA